MKDDSDKKLHMVTINGQTRFVYVKKDAKVELSPEDLKRVWGIQPWYCILIN